MASFGRLGSLLHRTAAAALRRHGEELDRAAEEGSSPELGGEEPGGTSEREGVSEPRVLLSHARLHLLWKPQGWTVSVRDEDAEEVEKWRTGGGWPMQDWAAARFGAEHPIALDTAVSNGFIHRLDRGTSGLLLWAQTYRSYYAARLEFGALRVFKAYLCACVGWPSSEPRLLDAPLLPVERRSAGGAWRSAVAGAADSSAGSRPARTEILWAGHLTDEGAGGVGLLCVRLHTGRRHQIRAHLEAEGHPLVGDAAYGGSGAEWCRRMFLHAWRLRLDVGEEGPLSAMAPLPPELGRALASLAPADPRSRALAKAPEAAGLLLAEAEPPPPRI